jgi:predicted transcriptional regulator
MGNAVHEAEYAKVLPRHTFRRPKEYIMSANTVRPIAIKIDQETRDRVKRLADARQRSSHWMMKEAISQYLEREEKREALRQDAINAWKEYQSTGMHVGAEEVTAWLETWGEEDEQAAPVCHK